MAGRAHLRRPAELAVRRLRAGPGALRHRGRRRDHPGHRDRPAAAGRRRACSPRSSSSRTRPTPSPTSASPPATRSARSPPPPASACCRPSRPWCSSASAAGPWPRPVPPTPTSMTAVIGGQRRRGAGRAGGPGPDRGQQQRQRPDRRRRHHRAAGGPGRRPADPGPADPAERRRRLPHRAHGARGGPSWPAWPGPSPPTIRGPGCCPTPTARSSTTAARCSRRLVGQVASPVRWDLCLAAMADLGVTGLLEMPPAGTLTGIAKRNLKGVELFALNTPDQLDDAMAFVRKHGGRSPMRRRSPATRPGGWSSPRARASSPGPRTSRPTPCCPATARSGVVKNLRDEIPVSAPHGGIVVEWLVENGDPVAPGPAAAAPAPDRRVRRRHGGNPMIEQGGRPP